MFLGQGLGRRSVLSGYLFEFFLEFVVAHIVHLPQFVDLFQRQPGLAEISNRGLAVVLRKILECLR